MAFLPVVQRELLVASRKGSTFWSRTLSAGLLLALSAALFQAFNNNPALIGPRVLQTISVVVFLECMIAGVRYTSDCLSEEKREGTLGLLFLTNLSGLDVVLGKMIARSLSAIYNLLAVIPILALPVMIGGVTGHQVAALSTVLLVATILSLSAGAMISSRGLRERTVLIETVLFLILVAVVPRVLHDIRISKFYPFDVVGWLSPLHAFIEAGRGWVPAVTAACWTMLAMIAAFITYASWRIRRWHRDAEGLTRLDSEKRSRLNFDGSTQIRTARKYLLAQNPLLWLALRSRTSGSRVFSFALFVLLYGVFCRIAIEYHWSAGASFVLFGSYGVHALYKFMIVAETTRQLNEDRRNGALELLLSTPIPPPLFIRGQIQATARTWMPVAICLAVMNITWMTESSFQRELGFLIPCSIVLLLLDSYTLAWRALANALKGELYTRTVFRTFFQVIAPPLALIAIILAAVIGTPTSKETIQGIFVFWFIASAAFDIVLIRHSKTRLNRFRALASAI